MVFALEVLNSDATLNTFLNIGSTQFVQGAPLELVLRVIDADKSLRYVLDATDTTEIEFKNSDGTTLIKAGTFPFTGDMSVLKFSLSETETLLLISQTITVDISNSGILQHVAIIKNGIQSVSEGC